MPPSVLPPSPTQAPGDLDYAAVALLAVVCSLLECLVGKDGLLNDRIPDFALLQALQVGGRCGAGWGRGAAHRGRSVSPHAGVTSLSPAPAIPLRADPDCVPTRHAGGWGSWVVHTAWDHSRVQRALPHPCGTPWVATCMPG